MVLLGAVGLGLVWGWVSARLVYRARWDVVVRVLLGLAALGLVALRLGGTLPAYGFGGAVVVGALLCMAWVRSLERRFASTR